MTRKTLTIRNEEGLQARPAALLVQVAGRFTSSLWVEQGSKRVNAKSIMGMMSLSVGNGDQVVVVTEGVDEVAAADEIETYLMAQ